MRCCSYIPARCYRAYNAIATHSSDDEDEDDDEEEPAESVTLDDFLFGGENEGEQIAKHRKHVDDEIASHHKAEPEGEEKAETEKLSRK